MIFYLIWTLLTILLNNLFVYLYNIYFPKNNMEMNIDKKLNDDVKEILNDNIKKISDDISTNNKTISKLEETIDGEIDTSKSIKPDIMKDFGHIFNNIINNENLIENKGDKQEIMNNMTKIINETFIQTFKSMNGIMTDENNQYKENEEIDKDILEEMSLIS